MPKIAIFVLPVLLAATVLAEEVPLAIEVIGPGCAVGLTITAASEVAEGQPIPFLNNLTVKRKSFVIEYWAEWEDGRIAKQPKNTTNTKEKSFTPRKVNSTQTLILKSRLVSVDCEDTTSDDNTAETLVLVRVDAAENTSSAVQQSNKTHAQRNITTDRPARRTPTTAAVYESSATKSKRFAVWFLLALIGLLAAVLIWRR